MDPHSAAETDVLAETPDWAGDEVLSPTLPPGPVQELRRFGFTPPGTIIYGGGSGGDPDAGDGISLTVTLAVRNPSAAEAAANSDLSVDEAALMLTALLEYATHDGGTHSRPVITAGVSRAALRQMLPLSAGDVAVDAAGFDGLLSTTDTTMQLVAQAEETHDRSRLRSWPGVFGGIHSIHLVDEGGNPAGGETYGRGFTIDWQDGPLLVDGVRQEPNGACVEDLLEAVLDRMRFYQEGKFSSRHNQLTITRIEEALLWQRDRTRERQLRGVEGTHTV